VSFYSFILSEYFTEIEPFRTFVLKLNREWYFDLYFIILSLGSVIIYRAFCRYLCPLGAALAIPAYFKKVPFVKMKRYDFCRTCKICTRGCAARAIRPSGVIDSRECLDCLDCQVNYWDEEVCPVLIRRKREGGRP
jgi:NosR/NirI family nitrous oxide reductase transcriptional regulator